MVLATGARHPTTDCACSELTRALSFAIGVRSQGYFDAEGFRYRLFADETKPELPLALWIQISRVESRNPRWFGISSRSPQRVLLMPRRVLESISWLTLLRASCLVQFLPEPPVRHNIPSKAGW